MDGKPNKEVESQAPRMQHTAKEQDTHDVNHVHEASQNTVIHVRIQQQLTATVRTILLDFPGLLF